MELSLFCLATLSLILQTAAYSTIQLPPQGTIEVVNGSSITVVYRIWFNSTEQDLLFYAGFNRTIHFLSGVFRNGNLNVTYSTACRELACFGFNMQQIAGVSVGVGQVERCETARVTVLGHQDVDGGLIKFHLFERSSFFNSVIARIAIKVFSDTASTTSEPDNLTFTNSTTTPPTETTTSKATTIGSSNVQRGYGENSADSSGIYVLAGIFFFMMGVNLSTVGVLILWIARQDCVCRCFNKSPATPDDDDVTPTSMSLILPGLEKESGTRAL